MNEHWVRTAEKILSTTTRPSKKPDVTIGYFPGTSTHKRDMELAYPAILRLLSELPHVKLVISEMVGLDDFPELLDFGPRIEIVKHVHWKQLAYELRKADVNIAPLELNAFCQSKSELKYFQAAVLGIPSVASPTRPFKRAIRHGVTGFLASTEDDWYRCLKILVQDSSLRRSVGDNARQHALDEYTVASISKEASHAYESIIRDHRAAGGAAKHHIGLCLTSTGSTAVHESSLQT